MTHVSLFTGIGGLDLAAEWAGFETVLQVERDPYCLRVLERHWPNVPRITDVREVTRESVSGPVAVVSGGFPCQPFSQAGKRRGAEDDRYLWPEMLRVVRELSPTYVVAENVPGLLSLDDGAVFESVLSDLEREGYETLPLHYPAASVGAPHRRDRVFIVAHANEHRQSEFSEYAKQRCGELVQNAARIRRREERARELAAPSTNATDTDNHRHRVPLQSQSEQRGRKPSDARRDGEVRPMANSERIRRHGGRQEARDGAAGQSRQKQPSGCGAYVADRNEPGLQGHGRPDERTHEWLAWKGRRSLPRIWKSEPPVGRVASGVPSRVDRLRALGNAVVPQQAWPIFASIAAMESARQSEEDQP